VTLGPPIYATSGSSPLFQAHRLFLAAAAGFKGIGRLRTSGTSLHCRLMVPNPVRRAPRRDRGVRGQARPGSDHEISVLRDLVARAARTRKRCTQTSYARTGTSPHVMTAIRWPPGGVHDLAAVAPPLNWRGIT
jgi:hypothetical protein